MQFVDAATVSGTRRPADGYLVADVRTAWTGIQIYLGPEVGRPEMETVRVWCPEAEVFARDSLATYAHKPVTLDHPAEPVTRDNWKALAIGQVGDEIARDGEFVRVPLVVMDASAIRAIEAGKRALSAGYACDLSFEAGHTPAGDGSSPRARETVFLDRIDNKGVSEWQPGYGFFRSVFGLRQGGGRDGRISRPPEQPGDPSVPQRDQPPASGPGSPLTGWSGRSSSSRRGRGRGPCR